MLCWYSKEMAHLVLHAQGTNPIYNLLPDIFSSLSAEPDLPSAHFQVALPLRTSVCHCWRGFQASAQSCRTEPKDAL